MSIDKHIDIMRDVYMTRAQREAYEQLLAQRDELLAALKEMTELAVGPVGGVTVDMKRVVVDKARAAIAKVEGGGA